MRPWPRAVEVSSKTVCRSLSEGIGIHKSTNFAPAGTRSISHVYFSRTFLTAGIRVKASPEQITTAKVANNREQEESIIINCSSYTSTVGCHAFAAEIATAGP